jgi:hypothetical protein
VAAVVVVVVAVVAVVAAVAKMISAVFRHALGAVFLLLVLIGGVRGTFLGKEDGSAFGTDVFILKYMSGRPEMVLMAPRRERHYYLRVVSVLPAPPPPPGLDPMQLPVLSSSGEQTRFERNQTESRLWHMAQLVSNGTLFFDCHAGSGDVLACRIEITFGGIAAAGFRLEVYGGQQDRATHLMAAANVTAMAAPQLVVTMQSKDTGHSSTISFLRGAAELAATAQAHGRTEISVTGGDGSVAFTWTIVATSVADIERSELFIFVLAIAMVFVLFVGRIAASQCVYTCCYRQYEAGRILGRQHAQLYLVPRWTHVLEKTAYDKPTTDAAAAAAAAAAV